jgi:pimeloyl-ACP methyl ester carboxylesterase
MLRRVTDRLVESAASAVDLALRNAVARRVEKKPSATLARDHALRLAFLDRVSSAYGPAPTAQFFDPGRPIEPLSRHRRDDRGRHVLDLTWRSHYTPHWAEFGERYLSHTDNQLASARLFLRASPRPIAILVHGYLSGHYRVEQRIWPLEALDDAGFDVALFVLPFHAKRAGLAGGAPLFPGSDPRYTNEGFRQAVGDLTGLVRYLRAQGHPRVGLFGMSLGGYTAALTATVEPGLDFLVPVVPLACLADFSREQGLLGQRSQDISELHTRLERVYRPVSPLAAPPLIAKDRVLVVGARADRITPINHARRIATHFSAPLIAFRGGHLLQLGRERAFARVFDLLERVKSESVSSPTALLAPGGALPTGP